MTMTMIKSDLSLPVTLGNLFVSLLAIFFLGISSLVAQELRASKTRRNGLKGLRKLGLQGPSGIRDQYNPKFEHRVEPDRDAQGKPTWNVKALFLHPIKSCKATEVSEATVVATGFKHDREFTFARWTDAKRPYYGKEKHYVRMWQMLTLRQCPSLALVRANVWARDVTSMTSKRRNAFEGELGVLEVSFPMAKSPSFLSLKGMLYLARSLAAKILTLDLEARPMLTFLLPIRPTTEQKKKFNLGIDKMMLFLDDPILINMRNAIPAEVFHELSQFLGMDQEITLFQADPEHWRECFRNAPSKEELGYQPLVNLADGYPLHLNNMASIRNLAMKLPNKFGRLDVLRFRVNILMTGPAAFEEDHWTRCRIGEAVYRVTNRTARCSLPNVNPATGTTDKPGTAGYMQPLKAMKDYRCIDKGTPTLPCLGMMMVPEVAEERIVRVGDEVELLETGEHSKIP